MNVLASALDGLVKLGICGAAPDYRRILHWARRYGKGKHTESNASASRGECMDFLAQVIF